MTPPLPLIIDCDPGIDDAVMLMMALGSPRFDVRAITTVAGNVPLRLTSRNARLICERMGRPDIPVFAGCPRPLLRAPVTAEDFHGESGIYGIEVFEPKAPLKPAHAVTEIIRQLKSSPARSFTLVVTGPMTNIACALVMAPEIADAISEIVIMGGANVEGGNITPFAEFNIFADPHAAATVLDSGIPATLLSLDASHQVRATEARIDRIAAIGGPRAEMIASLLRAANNLEARARPGTKVPMHDPSTIAWLLAPEMFETVQTRVSVVTRPGKEFGRTRVKSSKKGPHRWVTRADADAFFTRIEDILKAQP
ncbi:nucleoside hydrolase [Hyphomonas sp. WL0036]|uniref:nucleoside hydrolase n=1 Tax=Hyphomonas sediminis TaxID=2866160 RepID=UPI001C7F5639|nr:nucleoside hydrolase [Hyphomonas sediminis]MBY9065802.1 nucleoside hydrolase [Hyphomonas sediminis]